MVRSALVFLLLTTLGVPVCAQTDEGNPNSEADTAASARSADWLVLPYASYAPDTKLSAGIVAGYFLPSRDGHPASSVQASITVTQRRQLTAKINPELYLNEGQWRVQGALEAKHFPSSFHGIGGDTPPESEESYTARYGALDLTAQRRVHSHLRFGPRVFLRIGNVRDIEEDGLIDREQVPGSGGGITSGLGVSALWDARNSIHYPTTGTYAEVVATYYSAVLGSDHTFGRLESDFRGYQPLGPGTLAGQVYTEVVVGTAPFQLMPLLGGDERMRGYRRGRFREDLYWTLQAEYRIPIVWRLKGTVFTSMGEVAPRFGPELGRDIEMAVGAGGRLRLTEDGVHGRLDVAYSRTGFEFYLALGEAF